MKNSDLKILFLNHSDTSQGQKTCFDHNVTIREGIAGFGGPQLLSGHSDNWLVKYGQISSDSIEVSNKINLKNTQEIPRWFEETVRSSWNSSILRTPARCLHKRTKRWRSTWKVKMMATGAKRGILTIAGWSLLITPPSQRKAFSPENGSLQFRR